MKVIAFLIVLTTASPALAQESRIASDWRRERQHIAENCDEFAAKALMSCAVTLVTDYPFHLALGNLAPQNGFAFGLAFSERYTPNEDWRISFNADAVAATTSSWRAGFYTTLIRTKVGLPTPTTGTAAAPSNVMQTYPVVRAYVQHTVLNHLVDFGPDFDAPVERIFGEDQTVAGGSAVLPFNQQPIRALGAAIIGGMQGRFISIHDAPERDSFFELFEDLRLRPSLANGHVRLNYSGRLQQFFGDSDQSFKRWTVDLRHEFPLYRTASSTGPKEFNGPDDCSIAPGGECPPLTFSRNLGGSIGFRILASSSSPFEDGGSVPFYLQPTIGGSDIDNQRLLGNFEDYRFRAPHIIALQATFEHSIWGPVGAYLTAERGKAAQQRSDLDFNDLLSGYSAGLSLRAGGAPVATASISWGSSVGHRFIVTMDSSLLGGSSRPSLH